MLALLDFTDRNSRKTVLIALGLGVGAVCATVAFALTFAFLESHRSAAEQSKVNGADNEEREDKIDKAFKEVEAHLAEARNALESTRRIDNEILEMLDSKRRRIEILLSDIKQLQHLADRKFLDDGELSPTLEAKIKLKLQEVNRETDEYSEMIDMVSDSIVDQE